jgi:hypothetical protein
VVYMADRSLTIQLLGRCATFDERQLGVPRQATLSPMSVMPLPAPMAGVPDPNTRYPDGTSERYRLDRLNDGHGRHWPCNHTPRLQHHYHHEEQRQQNHCALICAF